MMVAVKRPVSGKVSAPSSVLDVTLQRINHIQGVQRVTTIAAGHVVECLALPSGYLSMHSSEQTPRCQVIFWLAQVLKMRAQRRVVLAADMFKEEFRICRFATSRWHQPMTY